MIQEPGEFSIFPGYDRTLFLLEGNELLLHSKNPNELIKLTKGEIYYFSGEAQISAEIPSGRVKDLNLIYRRGINSKLKMINLSKKGQKIPIVGINLIYVVHGSIVVSEDDQKIADAGDTVFIEGMEHSLHLQAKELEARVIFIGIETP